MYHAVRNLDETRFIQGLLTKRDALELVKMVDPDGINGLYIEAEQPGIAIAISLREAFNELEEDGYYESL